MTGTSAGPAAEIELKLTVNPADADKVRAGFPFDGDCVSHRHLVATYFDTAEGALRRAGLTLRIRIADGVRVQTIKRDRHDAAGLFARDEWEFSVDGDTPRPHPALAEALGGSSLDRLAPRFVSDVHRIVSLVEDGDAVVEAVLDVGEIRAGDRAEPICEVELELLRGAPTALFALARRINRIAPVRPGAQSKAERGSALADGPAPPAIKAPAVRLDADDDVATAFRSVVTGCIRHYLPNEARVLSDGGVEAVHQARVAIRRLRSALSLFRPMFAEDARLETIKRLLRAIGKALGEVRDLDVLGTRADVTNTAPLQAARGAALARARELLSTLEIRGVAIDLLEWLSVGEWNAEVAAGKASDFAGARLDKRRKQLKKGSRDIATMDDAHRHRVRIAAKKLRYASEFFAGLFPGEKRAVRRARFRDRTEALQDVLGALNDLSAGPALLAGIGIAAPGGDDAARRKRLLSQAESAVDALLSCRPFWR